MEVNWNWELNSCDYVRSLINIIFIWPICILPIISWLCSEWRKESSIRERLRVMVSESICRDTRVMVCLTNKKENLDRLFSIDRERYSGLLFQSLTIIRGVHKRMPMLLLCARWPTTCFWTFTPRGNPRYFITYPIQDMQWCARVK